MNAEDIKSAHDEIDELLPWFVNGTLTADETDRVDRHLVDCATCREEVVALRVLAGAVSREVAAPLVPEPPVERFLGRLDSAAVVPATGNWQRWAMAAGLVVAAVLLGIFSLPETSESPENFRALSDVPDVASVAYVFAVVPETAEFDRDSERLRRFAPGAELTRSSDGYRLVVTMPSVTVSELDAFARDLQRLEGIAEASLVGVQLPVE